MIFLVVLVLVALLLAANLALWRVGAVETAERPEPVLDRPLTDARERKAILKRLRRWKEEGKLTVEEYEHVRRLCDAEWDPAEADV